MTSTTGHEIDPDGVDHPAHYNLHPSGVECIDLIRDLNFNIGSAVKYIHRRGIKDAPLKDIDKAIWYLRDHLYGEDGERRLERAPYGVIRYRWMWDELIAIEAEPLCRKFYLAIAREDMFAALNALNALREQTVAEEGL